MRDPHLDRSLHVLRRQPDCMGPDVERYDALIGLCNLRHANVSAMLFARVDEKGPLLAFAPPAESSMEDRLRVPCPPDGLPDSVRALVRDFRLAMLGLAHAHEN